MYFFKKKQGVVFPPLTYDENRQLRANENEKCTHPDDCTEQMLPHVSTTVMKALGAPLPTGTHLFDTTDTKDPRPGIYHACLRATAY